MHNHVAVSNAKIIHYPSTLPKKNPMAGLLHKPKKLSDDSILDRLFMYYMYSSLYFKNVYMYCRDNITGIPGTGTGGRFDHYIPGTLVP